MYSNLVVERLGSVTVISLSRPRVLNALSKALKTELSDALSKVAANPDIRAVVLTGAGKAFSAGQDLNEATDLDGAGAAEWFREYQRLYQQIRLLEVPLIAAVNGWAVGAGCQLALLADFRLASPTARFGMPEIKDGIPAIFGLALLSNVIGMSRSIEMVLTGEPLSANEALKAGLVSRVVPARRLMSEAKALAGRLAGFAPLAMRLNKQWARRLSDQVFQAAVEFGVEAQRAAFASGDAKREMEEFLRAGKSGTQRKKSKA